MQSITRNPSGKLLGMLAALALLAGCGTSAPKVRSDYDRNVNFAGYKTFGFPPSPSTDRGGYATLVTQYFKDAVTHEMTAHGYSYSETEPDLLVNFYSSTHEKVDVYPNYYGSMWLGYGYGYGRYGYPRYGWYSGWPYYEPAVDVVKYTAGQFKIDVIDAKRLQTVWEASVEDRLTETALDNPQPNIARLVSLMMTKVPYSGTTKQ